MRVMFLVRSLDYGGAESQLLLLVKILPGNEVDSRVVTFYGQGKLFPQFEHAGVKVIPLNKKGRWDVIPFLVRLVKMVRSTRPDVIYSLLAVPNILGALIRIFFPEIKLVMGVRGSSRDLKQYDWLYRLSFWLEAKASRRADAVIVNSYAGAEIYIQKGFPEARMNVIHNGIDSNYFYRDRQGRRLLRSEWGLQDNAVLVGMVGRLDPVKDHPAFLMAAAKVKYIYPKICFVVIGDGPQVYLEQLKGLSAGLGLSESVRWEPARQDIRQVYNALDILCLSSKGEGFPNVIAEAMACGVPCVATRVGDVPLIVGETGRIVQPENAGELSQALIELISFSPEKRSSLGENAAQRIRTYFGVENLVQETMLVLKTTVENS